MYKNSEKTPPPPIGEFTETILKTSAIIAAGKLNLFKALDQKSLSVSEIVKTLGVSESGIRILLDALVSVGYLVVKDGRYSNAAGPNTWFTESGFLDFTPLLLWWSEVLPYMVRLDQAVQNEKACFKLWNIMEKKPETGRNFSLFMKASSKLLVKTFMESVVLSESAHSMLDIGGSHGLFSIALCKRYSKLRSVIFDLPSALSETEQNIAKEGLAERITIRKGDFSTDDIGRGYDVVLCLRVIHDHPDDVVKALLKKISDALNPGGETIILTPLKDKALNSVNALFSLLFYFENGGRTFGYEELADWLSHEDLKNCKRDDLPPNGQFSVITAKK